MHSCAKIQSPNIIEIRDETNKVNLSRRSNRHILHCHLIELNRNGKLFLN